MSGMIFRVRRFHEEPWGLKAYVYKSNIFMLLNICFTFSWKKKTSWGTYFSQLFLHFVQISKPYVFFFHPPLFIYTGHFVFSNIFLHIWHKSKKNVVPWNLIQKVAALCCACYFHFIWDLIIFSIAQNKSTMLIVEHIDQTLTTLSLPLQIPSWNYCSVSWMS